MWQVKVPIHLEKHFNSLYDFYNIPRTEDFIGLPSSRQFASCTAGSQFADILCIGGKGIFEKHYILLNDMWLWNSVAKRWTEIQSSNPPSPRLFPGIWTVGNKIYYGGGMLENGILLSDFYVFDTLKKQWTELKDTGFPIVYKGHSWKDSFGNLWYFGEDLEFNEFMSTSYFNERHQRWTTIPLTKPLAVRRSYVLWPIEYSFGSFYMFGGRLRNDKCTTELWLYDHNVGWSILSNTSVIPNYKTLPLTPGCFAQGLSFKNPSHMGILYFLGEVDRHDIWSFNTLLRRWSWLGGFPKAFPLAWHRENFMVLPPLNGSAVWKDYQNNINIFGGSAANNTVYYNLIWQLNKQLL
jgi:hypothetical protein